jgi:hypothetical protein
MNIPIEELARPALELMAARNDCMVHWTMDAPNYGYLAIARYGESRRLLTFRFVCPDMDTVCLLYGLHSESALEFDRASFDAGIAQAEALLRAELAEVQ